ncbi:MAG: Rne/Rng family ribonuclease [Rickettsiales bacterium]
MKKIIIDGQYSDDIRVAIINENNILEDLFSNKSYTNDVKNIKLGKIQGNIYLARIKSIQKSLQAVFIDYGGEVSGFLPFNHIHPIYYTGSNNKNVLSTFKKLNILEILASDTYNTEIFNNEPDINVSQINNEKSEDLDSNFNEIQETLNDSLNNSTNQQEKKIEIHHLLKKDQLILVQAHKEPKGQKSYMFSTYISLIGRYIVLLPNQKGQIGVSRKVTPNQERNRIKKIIHDIIDPVINTSGLIARTGSLNKTIADIKNDYNYCARLWNKILSTAIKHAEDAPLFLYKEEGIIIRIMRDFLDHRVSEVIIQGEHLYKEAIAFTKDLASHDMKKIFKYQENIPIFIKYDIETQILNLYKPFVQLESGAYLIINSTEALTAIDVNSGKNNSENNLIESSFKINQEAAVAAVKQIKLRNISGIIIIDFIDMQDEKHQKIIEAIVKKEFNLDKAKTQIGEINQFGLLELSRQRVSTSFLELHSKKCHSCQGRGVLRADDSDAFLLIRTLENEIVTTFGAANYFKLISNENRIYNFFNKLKFYILKLEKKYNINIELIVDSNISGEIFVIEKSYVETPSQKIALIDNQNLKIENMKQNYTIGNINSNQNIDEINLGENNLTQSTIIDTKIFQFHNINSNKNSQDQLFEKLNLNKQIQNRFLKNNNTNYNNFNNKYKENNQEKNDIISEVFDLIQIKFKKAIDFFKKFW